MNETLDHFFLAIPLPEEVRKLLKERADDLKQDFSYKQWPHEKDYHITLAFLGASEEKQINDLIQSVEHILDGQNPFSLRLNRIGTFGKADQPRVLWAGVSREPELFQLQENLHSACVSIGYQLDERPYSPHITLAKRWNGTGKIEPEKLDTQLEELSWEVREVVLYQIRLKQVPKYHPFKIFRF